MFFAEHYTVGVEEEITERDKFQKLYFGHRKTDRLPVVIKFVDIKNTTLWDYANSQKIPLSIFLMEKIYGGIVNILDIFKEPDHFIFVVEHSESAKELLGDKGIGEGFARRIFTHILKTIRDCEEMDILYRSCREENIVVNVKELSVKLIDYRYGCQKDPIYTTFDDHRLYAPPEFLRRFHYCGQQSTVWCLGILIHELVCGTVPFKDVTEIQHGGDVVIHHPLSEDCRYLIRQCLRVEISKRPLINDILKFPWML